MSSSKVNQVVDKFKSSIDTTNDYSIKDLTKILEGVYKEVYGNKKRNSGGEKKPPSAYNLFVKGEIEKIKTEGLPDVDPKDYMRIAAQRWKASKETKE
jgi:hypothetical protein